MPQRHTVIVTGAAQGIGRAIAERFARDGFFVVAVDRNADGLSSLASQNREQIETLVLDVTAPDASLRAVALAMKRFGRLDYLVNNAGIGNAKPVAETSDEELELFLSTNFSAAFRFTRAALGVMAAGAGIVHIASTFGLMGNPRGSSYAATKAALIGLTRQMAADYGPKGIRANAVAPGPIETPMVQERLESSEYFRRLVVETTPFPRIGLPGDVAGAVRFLCSDDAAFVNGHVLVVDGGWSSANYVPA